ncbi:MAG: 30S ribosomal protein S17 [Buchnera aphidicola (Periphyllus lyropictus)]|uniref:30S ribosomal protein S17 n=1 Tax=Buchnera aphidicola TaxID=9 RepID=UPI001ED79B83|nr:30S ribosomal protein S17 [Buchnera aphidicola]NIH16482.1 30S ribosomal protein S17 [Buchnera aphidicola (Periphyllus lyropictus)]USS94767.1 30S ribosomal protein S17 [Buchnera aphidicola (Periphyllus lyropictus)]
MLEKSKLLKGFVISNKMEKSAVVIVERFIKHPMYKKFIKKSTKFYIHDEKNECSPGDIVFIKECRPISKIKSWILVNIIKKSIS